MRIAFEENASPDIAQAALENAIVVVPLCCIEQHGPHLPVGTDYSRPLAAAERAAQVYGARVLVLPALPFGPAAEHVAFAGTISLSFEAWSRVVVEILENLVRDGFRRIVITKGCGGHLGIEGPVYQFYCRARRQVPDLDIRIYGGLPGEEMARLLADSDIAHPDEVHAGGIETSMVLARRPELVDVERLARPEKQAERHDDTWWIMENLSETGATGDPTRYDARLGRRLIDRMDEVLCDFIGRLWQAGAA